MVKESVVVKLPNGRFAKPCSKCGERQTYLRRAYAELSLLHKKMCKKCSNKEVENCHRGWYKGVRISWFNRFKNSAELRGIEFNIGIDYVAIMHSYQKGLCALTGWPIRFPETGHPQNTDASIDRIDNSKGYIVGNIQLVHKRVNMMKQHYTQEEFINVCNAVASNLSRIV